MKRIQSTLISVALAHAPERPDYSVDNARTNRRPLALLMHPGRGGTNDESFALLMIGFPKIERCHSEAFAKYASQCFVRKSPIRAVKRQKAVAYFPGVDRIRGMIWRPAGMASQRRSTRKEKEKKKERKKIEGPSFIFSFRPGESTRMKL